MPSGTQINNVFAARIHKQNAADVARDAGETVDWLTQRLLILAATAPGPINEQPWVDYVQTEVPKIVEDLIDADHKRWLAEYIVENPEDCKDELVDADWAEEEPPNAA